MGKAPHPLDRWRAANAAEADAVRAAAATDTPTEETSADASAEDGADAGELLLGQPHGAPDDGAPMLPARRGGVFAIGAVLGLIGAGWIGFLVGGVVPTTPDLPAIANSIALACGPRSWSGWDSCCTTISGVATSFRPRA